MSPLGEELRRIIDEERREHTTERGQPPGRRALARRVARRLAEVAVNAVFPTNSSGNNMSRG